MNSSFQFMKNNTHQGIADNHLRKEINKNWVTVRDKCPQINVQFKWHTFLKKKLKNRTDGHTDGRTDERTDGPIILCPKFYLEA